MMPIKYTAAELLKLKGSQLSQIRLDQLKSNCDFGIIKHTPNAHQHCAKKAKDENMSSTDSEEQILFQGKKARQPISSLDGETEWKYRARTSSERNSSEPVDAPTGLDAQRSEGFQRFFKAVVSPTHVRVTAGGRIVPNTRNTASPTAKWDKEQSTMENETSESATTDPPKQSTSENVGNHQMAQQHGPTILPPMMMPPPTPWYPCYPPMTPIYAPGPLPYYPVPHPMAMPLGMPQAPPNMAFVPHNPAFQGLPQVVPKPVEGNDSGMGSKKHRPPPIKITSHDQFQQMPQLPMPTLLSVPNGAGMHGQMTPLGNDGRASAQQIATAHGATFSHRSPMAPMYPAAGGPTTESTVKPPMTTDAVKSTMAESATKMEARYNPSLFAPIKTPVTSIKSSQITKAQLISLRATLKFYEDQLHFNKHQIDEKATEDQVKNVRNTIEEFECSLKKQVEEELHGTALPKKSDITTPRAAGATYNGNRTPPMTLGRLPEYNTGQAFVRGKAANPPNLPRIKSTDQLRRKNPRDIRQRAGINCSKALDTTAALCKLENHLLEEREKKGNPIQPFTGGALVVPPFEPSSVLQMPSIAEASLSGSSYYSRPYLVGRLPKGMDPLTARDTAYIYPRELNENEKRARHVYWGGISSKGSGLPKFDGKDFYPASPVSTPADAQPNAPRPAAEALTSRLPGLLKKAEDPFQTGRDTLASAPKKNKKFSHAVPIINPNTLTRENNTGTDKSKATPAADDAEAKSPAGDEQSAPSRRALDRSRSSNNDLWQGMMKKTSASNSVFPSSTLANATVTSTTAQGYVQEYLDQAASSLCPSISANGNTNGNTRGSSSDKSDAETVRQQAPMEKMDENCPPPKKPTSQDEIIADLNERVFRDAERRGVINPRWQ